MAIGVRWPVSPSAWAALSPSAAFGFQWQLGNTVLVGDAPGRVLFWARVPMLLIALLLGWVLWAWGRRMLGDAAAVGALVLFALDPVLIAHGPLVTTDVGCAAFVTLSVFALWRYLQRRTPGRLLLCGLALGAALAAKFSAVFLLPIAALVLLLGTPLPLGRRLLWTAAALVAISAAAVVVVEAAYFFPRDPWLYVRGLRQVYRGIDPRYLPYMAGEFRRHFWSYELVAYLLKEPLPSVVLAGVGLWTIARPGLTVADRACLLVPPAVLGAAYAAFAANLGVRYAIPLLPFLHLIGGAGLAALLAGGRARRVCAWLLVAWLATAALGIYPDHLSYFNETACALSEPRQVGLDGGSRCGPHWLDDSNVDWGQGVRQLAAWVQAHPGPEPLRLAYFGSFPPEASGLRYEPLDARILVDRPPAGRYVLSAHIVARLRGALRARPEGGWLLGARPTAIVGHAYYVWDVETGR